MNAVSGQTLGTVRVQAAVEFTQVQSVGWFGASQSPERQRVGGKSLCA